MSTSQTPTEACHNCRRRRLKCDRSLPHCLKCMKRGEECLGYQRLFRWEQGIASRGKMAGKTFQHTQIARDEQKDIVVPLHRSLADPLVQDLNYASRNYLSYFVSDVIRNLVLYDKPEFNPFRELIPLTLQYPVLLQVIIANSALHMSNARQKSLASNTSTPLFDSWSNATQSSSYKDALAAKQRALYLLKSALANIAAVNIDVVLAVVLLFIEFELIDSGRDGWKYHVRGAKTIIEKLCGSDISTHKNMSTLRSCLISNCLVFDILGSTLARPVSLVPSDTLSSGALSLLQDAEGNHCSSFPVALLQLLQAGTQLSQLDGPENLLPNSHESKQQQALLLLQTAQAFNPLVWAINLQSRSPATDFMHRVHVASAHRAAVSIYLSRVLLSFCPGSQLLQEPGELVADVIYHISLIRPNDPLFTSTTWPAFIAGAETNDRAIQDLLRYRFCKLWEVEPWGLIRGALGLLEKVWFKRRTGLFDHDYEEGPSTAGSELSIDWIGDLRANAADWLIL